MTQYLTPARYRELIQALLSGEMDEHDRENAIKIALGELADIWPDYYFHEVGPKQVYSFKSLAK